LETKQLLQQVNNCLFHEVHMILLQKLQVIFHATAQCLVRLSKIKEHENLEVCGAFLISTDIFSSWILIL